MKTKCFFKWCQYIEQVRFIKSEKNREVENLKKSKMFNNYTGKFQYFTAWKHHCKKAQSNKRKASII